MRVRCLRGTHRVRANHIRDGGEENVGGNPRPSCGRRCQIRGALARHLGEFGEIRITRTEPESLVIWEGEKAAGPSRARAIGLGDAGHADCRGRNDRSPLHPSRWNRPGSGSGRGCSGAARPRRSRRSPDPPAPAIADEQGDAALNEVLDTLGAAHHRPFSRFSLESLSRSVAVTATERRVLTAPGPIARAAARYAPDAEQRWLLGQPRGIRCSYADEVYGRPDEDLQRQIWMLRQPAAVRESYIAEVLLRRLGLARPHAPEEPGDLRGEARPAPGAARRRRSTTAPRRPSRSSTPRASTRRASASRSCSTRAPSRSSTRSSATARPSSTCRRTGRGATRSSPATARSTAAACASSPRTSRSSAARSARSWARRCARSWTWRRRSAAP